MHPEVELVVDCRNDLGETPVWCARTQTLYWIDVPQPGRVFHFDSRDQTVDFYEFDDLVTGLALRAHGGLLVAGTRELREFDTTTHAVRKIFSLPGDQAEHRFNDGACDRAGRFWVGSMQNNFLEKVRAAGQLESSGRIYCISADGSSRSFDAQLGCPNAMCWSADGATFYAGDSCDGWIYAYDFALTAGQIYGRRKFCRFAELGVPDGATVDSEGYIWNARWGAGVVVRISPDGKIDQTVQIPATQPSACCFGGPNLDTLYVTSARLGLTPEQLASEPSAGGIFAFKTNVAGLAKAPFGPL